MEVQNNSWSANSTTHVVLLETKLPFSLIASIYNFYILFIVEYFVTFLLTEYVIYVSIQFFIASNEIFV